MRQLFFALILGGCADKQTAPDTGSPEDLPYSLAAPGPHPVGYAQTELTYSDVLTGDARPLRLAVWYPAASETGTSTTYMGLFDAAENWPDGVFSDAPLATGPHPLVVFSHGHQGFAENSSFLMSQLASHGWVVAAPDHTGNTTVDGDDRTTEIYYQRPFDISAVIDHMQDGMHSVIGTDLTDSVMAIGHSFGGYTLHALAGATYDLETLGPACEDGTGPGSFCATMTKEALVLFEDGLADDRISAFVSMAPGDVELYSETGMAQVDRPILHMTGQLDDRTGVDSETTWNGLVAANTVARRIDMVGGGHQTFTDFSAILETTDGLISRDEGFLIVETYTLGFLRWTAGDESVEPLFDGEWAISDAAIVMP